MHTLITGASSGIGYELAKICASHGQNLILTARSTDLLNKLSNELKIKFHTTIEVISMDLGKPGSALKLFEIIQEKKWEVNILINNAGVGDHGSFSNSTLKKCNDMIQLNIISLIELTHLFLPQMIKRKNGNILNVASTAAFQPGPYMSVYYATKSFVLNFSEALAEELNNTGVAVTTLCPGPTESGFQKAANISNINVLKKAKLPSSKVVAEYAYSAMMKKEVVAIHGLKNRLLVQTIRFLPRSLIRKIIASIQLGRKDSL